MLIPTWLRNYGADSAVSDLVAGLVVAVMLVPQSLAYAMLAGLPPHVGLYASILPLLAYALFGSSMTLAVGPVAITSLMTASALAPLAAAGSGQYLALAGLLALLSGIMLWLAGLARLGFVANLLSHPVISGFISGSALLIIIGQLKPLTGIAANGHTAWEIGMALAARVGEVRLPTAAIGIAAIILLVLGRRYAARALCRLGLPTRPAELLAKLAPMLVVLAATATVAALGLDHSHGVAVVGSIPAGLPAFGLALPGLEQLRALLLPALVISLVGFVESVSVAQSLALKRRERIDANAELNGLGAANIASALSGGFPVTGGFARSVVNFAAGARTPAAGIVAALLMVGVLLGLTGIFETLPLAVLAATIIVAVSSLIDWETFAKAWQFDRSDAVAFAATALGVLLFGVEAGIAIGVLLSLAVFLWRASRPHIAVLGRLPGTQQFRNVLRAQVELDSRLVIVRIDENLFFGNWRAVETAIETALANQPAARHLLLVLSSVSRLDLTALEGLEALRSALSDQGVALSFAEVKGPVLDQLKSASGIGVAAVPMFLSTHDAVRALVQPA